MKKSILTYGKALNKTELHRINGGVGSTICYGPIGLAGCGTCEEYHALPPACQARVLVSIDCFDL
jgi:hypothetical protein